MTGDAESPSDLIDTKIAELGKWRGETLAWMRKLIRKADPDVVETVKWRKPTNPGGVPVWEYADILCSVETYKVYAKLKKCEFFKEKVNYLGHVVSRDGIATDVQKIHAIWDWPTLASVDNLPRGLAH